MTPSSLRLLAPLSLSERSSQLALEARAFAEPFHANLQFLHVGQDDAETRAQLQKATKDDPLQIVSGRPAKEILKAAREQKADLIAMGAPQAAHGLQYIWTSLSRQVAREAECSVLLVSSDAKPLPIRNMVVATNDVSDPAPLLQFALRLSQKFELRHLYLLREYSLGGSDWALEDDFDMARAENERQRIHSEEEVSLREAVSNLPFESPTPEIVSLRGHIGYESLEFDKQRDADLFVIEAPAHLGLQDRLFQHGAEFALESLPHRLLIFRPNPVTPG